MASPLLTETSQVTCAHQGSATAPAGLPRVMADGHPVIAQTASYTVAGCTLPPPPGGNGPCATGRWTTGTVRVTSMGQPLAFQASTGTCLPTGTPMTVRSTQARVSAS